MFPFGREKRVRYTSSSYPALIQPLFSPYPASNQKVRCCSLPWVTTMVGVLALKTTLFLVGDDDVPPQGPVLYFMDSAGDEFLLLASLTLAPLQQLHQHPTVRDSAFFSATSNHRDKYERARSPSYASRRSFENGLRTSVPTGSFATVLFDDDGPRVLPRSPSGLSMGARPEYPANHGSRPADGSLPFVVVRELWCLTRNNTTCLWRLRRRKKVLASRQWHVSGVSCCGSRFLVAQIWLIL